MTNSDRSKSVGRRLSLDFANTADWHASDQPVESLTGYPELVGWSLQVGILTESKAQQLLKSAERRPQEASAVLGRAIVLREAIYRLFSAIARGLPPSADDLATFNTELAAAVARSRIVAQDEGYTWDWSGGEDALDQMLCPVVRDAAELLTSGELDRVGQCKDDRCGWLFLDMSRNRSRRWCSMKSCGNRAKARRHYQRSQASAP